MDSWLSPSFVYFQTLDGLHSVARAACCIASVTPPAGQGICMHARGSRVCWCVGRVLWWQGEAAVLALLDKDPSLVSPLLTLECVLACTRSRCYHISIHHRYLHNIPPTCTKSHCAHMAAAIAVPTRSSMRACVYGRDIDIRRGRCRSCRRAGRSRFTCAACRRSRRVPRM